MTKWLRLNYNVIHDVDNAKVKVYINRYLKLEAKGRGGTSRAVRCEPYAQDGDGDGDGDSNCMEVKDIKILRK
ncbi:hypothetical protein CDL15_Pgr026339 [Punica granatum]|uniref:Uncharacterized protein n=1 Tax=Punica granatum TaxID=22663 RepID=A0A218WVG8_PUNGR|nr:hypothetical protein CDL15_Pgr026339 [Punica granatum]